MGRCVIVGGGPIRDYARLRRALEPGDFLLYCDGGLRHRAGLGAEPDLTVGDFDSWQGPRPAGEVLLLPREKDDTDTVFGVREALKRGFGEFLLLGALGGRLDHTLANLALLFWLDSQGRRAEALDEFSRLSVVSRSPAYVSDDFPFFSLLSLDGPARGVTVTGAKYPLSDAEIGWEYPYGVSNEPLPGCRAEIAVAEGRLLLVKVERDVLPDKDGPQSGNGKGERLIW